MDERVSTFLTIFNVSSEKSKSSRHASSLTIKLYTAIMKKTSILLTLLFILFSCTESKPENTPLIENAVDETSPFSKGSFESSRYDDNMVDRIYANLMKNNKKLSALDDKILSIQEGQRKVLEQYEPVFNTSDAYYRDARNQSSNITDSLLKYRIEIEITASAEKYKVKVQAIKTLIFQLTGNLQKINNLYTVFKIRKTLPEIEKYQQAHPLKTDSLEQLIKKQDQIMDQLKNIQ